MAKNPLILAVETSGRTGSVAIAAAEKILGQVSFSAPMKHSSEIFPAIQNLLGRFKRAPGEIDHIYISVGPGSFTGLRIAATLAKIMNLANNARIVTVETLDVIAANAIDYIKQENAGVEYFATILDAKRSQFFIAVYQNKQGNWIKIVPDCLMTAWQFLDRFADSEKPVWLLGEGLLYYAHTFKADGIRFMDKSCWYPKAWKVHSLGYKKALAGQFAEPLTLKPAYLRRPEAEEKWKQKTGNK